MTLLDTMKQALEALTNPAMGYEEHFSTITNLRAAIEQMEKVEPVAWMYEAHWGKGFSAQKTNDSDVPVYTAPVAPEGWKLVPVEPTTGDVTIESPFTPEARRYWEVNK